MFDVAVLGCGPAGCAAALTLRSCGVATTIIASSRTPEKPTETAVPRLKQLLLSLGATEALAACEPCYGIESSWGAPDAVFRPSILDPSGHAWFVHRKQFDATLNKLVDAAGVPKLEAEATSLSFAEDRVIVGTTFGSVEANNVLIATGSPAWAGRATGQTPMRVDSLLCYWTRLAIPFASRLLHVECTQTGWWYVCIGEAATTVACFLTDAECSRQLAPSNAGNWSALFQDTRICQQYALDAPARQIRCVPVMVEGLAYRHGPRWVAAGDAAIKLDPIGSSGTATALESGVLAARVLLASPHEIDAATETYRHWGNGLLSYFLKWRTSFYAAEAEKNPVGFWARRA